MGLLQARNRFSTKGLGNLQVREVYPTNDAEYINAGILDQEGSEIQDVVDQISIYDEEGKVQDVLFDNVGSRFVTNLKQVGLDEWNYIRNAITKRHSIRYSGLMNPTIFQYFCFEQGQIIPKTDRKFNADQKLPFEYLGVNKDTDGFETPDYYVVETQGRIRVENLQFWLSPRRVDYPGNGTAKVIDVSGFARHGDLNSDYSSIWKEGTPDAFLEFDGVNDLLNCGNILNDNGTKDRHFEIWIKIPAADASSVVIFGKKSAYSDVSAGYYLVRNSSNKILFNLADGTNKAEAVSVANVLQNIPTHVAITIDRNGMMQVYLNGAASGVPVSCASVASGNNNANFQVANIASQFGNLIMSDIKAYEYSAGELPSDIATIIQRHYNAEKMYYGL
ncbi:MAG: hypothetical protein H3C35_03710 [Bacteroidetes bacterium]|nr:hypothetical protein [Bacteroidota bacterium]